MYAHVYSHVYSHVYVHVYTHVSTHVSTHAHAHVYTHVCTHRCMSKRSCRTSVDTHWPTSIPTSPGIAAAPCCASATTSIAYVRVGIADDMCSASVETCRYLVLTASTRGFDTVPWHMFKQVSVWMSRYMSVHISVHKFIRTSPGGMAQGERYQFDCLCAYLVARRT